jgi:WD40 repeat protein
VITCMSYTPGGDIISAGGRGGSVFFMSAQTGEKILCPLRGHFKDNPDCTCQHYDEDGDKDYQQDPDCPVTGHTGSVLSVCFDHTGEKLASGGGYGDNSVRLWSTKNGASIGSPLTVDSCVNRVAYSPSGDTVAVGCDSGKVFLVDAITGQVKRALTGDRGILCVSFNPIGDVISAGDYGGKVRLYDVLTGEVKRALSGHSDW